MRHSHRDTVHENRVLENRLGARETWPEEGVLKKMTSLDQVQKILGLLGFGEVSYRKVSE